MYHVLLLLHLHWLTFSDIYFFFQSLLVKLDDTLMPLCDAEVQTEDIYSCSLCKCQSSFSLPHKPVPLEDGINRLESISQEKSFEAPAFVQMLASSPLMEFKQEIKCVSNTVASGVPQCQQVEMAITDVDLKDVKTKTSTQVQDNRLGNESDIEKCVLTPPLDAALGENMDLDYASSTHLDEETRGQVLMDSLVSNKIPCHILD